MITPEANLGASNTVIVLFSGGRDSSLAACLLAASGRSVHLLTTFNGATIKGEVANYRYEELRTSFSDLITRRTIVPSFGLFRRIALETIESDFARFKTNLIPLGDALATHTIAADFALEHNLSVIASGYAQYENAFPEQMPQVVALTRSFLQEYRITYLTPVYSYTHRNQVKQHLLEFGISPKSLEGTSLFADTFSTPSSEAVVDYVRTKLPICRDYIASRVANRGGRRHPTNQKDVDG